MNVKYDIAKDSHELHQNLTSIVENYLRTIGTKTNSNLYQLLTEEVEKTLFRTVMELSRYNQSKTARILGISRGNLRTKLKYYFDDKFIGTRDN